VEQVSLDSFPGPVNWSCDQLRLCYDGRMKDRVVSATEFKATCPALLDEIDRKGGTITVTKRGRPIATVGPARKQRYKSPEGMLKGKVEISEELLNVGLSDMSDQWEVLREK
jgi:prevent-host-death family protein